MSGCFEVFKPNFAPSYSVRSTLYSIPKTVVSGGPLRVFDLTSEVIVWPETLKLDTIGFRSLSATRSFFREAVSPSGAERLGGQTDPLTVQPLMELELREKTSVLR